MIKKPLVTLRNLHRQKLSTLILNVLEDIKKSKKMGIKLHMTTWAATEIDGEETSTSSDFNFNVVEENLPICTACLGGMAVCGFIKPPPTVGKWQEIISNNRDTLTTYQNMFNELRTNSLYDFAVRASILLKKDSKWEGKLNDHMDKFIYENYQSCFFGRIDYNSDKFKNLVRYIKAVGNHLKKGGY